MALEIIFVSCAGALLGAAVFGWGYAVGHAHGYSMGRAAERLDESIQHLRAVREAAAAEKFSGTWNATRPTSRNKDLPRA